MRIRHIILDSIKRNPKAGHTRWFVPGRVRTRIEKDGSIVSRREISCVRTMTPDPEYLFEYEPMEARCVHCGKSSPVEDFGDDYFFDGSDEYAVTDICPKCGIPDSVDEEIRYESIEEALKRRKSTSSKNEDTGESE